MSTIVTFASGKGGVGKSVVLSNVGLALANRGRRVVLADLDVGGSNLATLFGAFEEGPTLDDFLDRKVELLEDVARPLRRNLRLIVGAGESLATANPTWAMKQRLLRHLKRVDADVVLVDIGAGAGTHALDFFNAGDFRVLVTLPEPTASVDAYRFLKLAAVREAATRVSSRNPERRSLERRDFEKAADAWQTVALSSGPTPRSGGPPPMVVLNQAEQARRHFNRLQNVARRFLEQDLDFLGEVPRDEAVRESVARYLPVVEADVRSEAAKAIGRIAEGLIERIAAEKIARENEIPTRAVKTADPVERPEELPDIDAVVATPAPR